ncbi:MAG: peptidylprolyl isomerase [Gemmataceae bacterium]
MMKAQPRKTPGFRPRLEALEDRCVPADFSGTISGTAFVDRNANGRLNAGETVLRGAPVLLRGTTTQGTAVNVIARATVQGQYRFDNVMPGSYLLVGSAVSGRFTGAGTRVVITPGLNVSRNVAFGGVRPGAVNLRQFLNNSGPNSLPIPGAGSGVAMAAERANDKPIVKTALNDLTLNKNLATDTFVDMAAFFDDADMTNSRIRFKTTFGDINVELYDRIAPQTVANFFNYITSDAYDNTVFHRLVSGFVSQAGGFKYNEDLRTITAITDLPAVKNEPGTFNLGDPVTTSRSNAAGTIAMAKQEGNPNSATNEFFFNLSNNRGSATATPPGLDFQNEGFTVFGKIVGAGNQTEAAALTQLTNALGTFTATNKSSANSAFSAFPLKGTTAPNFPADAAPANLALITDVQIIKRDESLTYTLVSNSNAAAVSATFVNNQLRIKPVSGQTGTATLRVRATDKFGATVEQEFDVTVANNAPTAALTLTPASVNNSDTLTASVTATDPNGDTPISVTYEWKVGATVVRTNTVSGASTTDALNLATIPAVTLPGGVQPGDVVTVTATPNDGSVSGTPASATRTVGDRVPVMNSLGFTNGEVGVNDTLTVQAAATDPDGTPVTFTYVWMYGTETVRTTETVSTTDALDLSALTTITRATGDIVTVTVTPKSGTGVGTASTVTFTVDRSPVLDADGIADLVLTDHGTFLFDASDDFSDPDGDNLTFTATLDNGDPLPAWLTMGTDGTLSGDPPTSAPLSLEIRVRATDPVGRFATGSFTLSVTNDAPQIVSVDLGPASPASNATVTATVMASDSNGDPVTVEYVWQRNGTQVSTVSLTGTTTTASLDLSAFGFVSGDLVTVLVTPTDGNLTGPPSSQSVTVA